MTPVTPIAVQPVLVIIGPSGSGKSSAARELDRRGLIRVHPSWTTRGRRPDERHGSCEHRFVSDARFQELTDRGFFLDTVTMFGLPFRYGIPHLPPPVPGRIDAVMLRAPLVDQFTRLVPNRVVYQIEDGADRVRERLMARKSSRRDIAARIQDNYQEIEMGRRVADRVFINNGRLQRLVDRMSAALRVDAACASTSLGVRAER